MPDETITLQAHAKLNLALAVGPPIEDGPSRGMHPIASWMVPIDLADTVSLTRLGSGPSRHTIRWSDGRATDWPTESDLAVRAHRALEAHTGPLPAEITVTKRTPAGGGLGGGSSDAAAVLRGLDHVLGLGLSERELVSVALTLGSDIPFFIDTGVPPHASPRPAFVTGLGEHIKRLPSPRLDGLAIVLVCPPFGCHTGAVYRAFDQQLPEALRIEAVESLTRAEALDPAGLFNDLAAPAERVEPRLAELRRDLADTLGLPVHVSGSGSTLFVLVQQEEADAITADLAARHPDSVVQRVGLAYLADQESD